MNQDELWKYIIFPIFATLGGIVNYSRRAIERGTFSRLEFIVEAVSASFIGLMVTLGGDAMHLSPHWLGMGAGMAGWLGADFVRSAFSSFIMSKIGNPTNGYDENSRGRKFDD